MRYAKQRGAAIAKGRRDLDWLSSAPVELIAIHGKRGSGWDVLDLLLKDRRMARAWVQIERHRGAETSKPLTPFEYSGLWGAICTALSRANKEEKRRKAPNMEPLHVEKKKRADKACWLASRLVAHLGKDGPLDFLAHSLFPGKVEDPAKVEDLALRHVRDPKLNKAAVSLANTTFVELLGEFQNRAQKSVEGPPIVFRVKAKQEAAPDARPLNFIRDLHSMFFEHRFGRPMHTVIAAIANVALDLSDHRELTGDAVRRALPGRSDNKRRE